MLQYENVNKGIENLLEWKFRLEIGISVYGFYSGQKKKNCFYIPQPCLLSLKLILMFIFQKNEIK